MTDRMALEIYSPNSKLLNAPGGPYTRNKVKPSPISVILLHGVVLVILEEGYED